MKKRTRSRGGREHFWVGEEEKNEMRSSKYKVAGVCSALKPGGAHSPTKIGGNQRLENDTQAPCDLKYTGESTLTDGVEGVEGDVFFASPSL